MAPTCSRLGCGQVRRAVGGSSYTCSMEPGGGVGSGQGPDIPSATAVPGQPDGVWSAGPASAALTAVAAALDALLAVDLAAPGTGELLDLLRGVERESRRLAGM